MYFTLDQIKAIVLDAALRYGIRGALAIEQIRQESNFNPQAVSSAGARGIAQFMPATGKAYGLISVTDFFDVRKSMEAWGKLMRDLKARYNGDEKRMLAAYNAGETAVNKYNGVPPFPETQSYVAIILKRAGAGAGLIGDILVPVILVGSFLFFVTQR